MLSRHLIAVGYDPIDDELDRLARIARITVEMRVVHPGANTRASQGMGVAQHRGVVERISGCQWCGTLTGSDARHVISRDALDSLCR